MSFPTSFRILAAVLSSDPTSPVALASMELKRPPGPWPPRMPVSVEVAVAVVVVGDAEEDEEPDATCSSQFCPRVLVLNIMTW